MNLAMKILTPWPTRAMLPIRTMYRAMGPSPTWRRVSNHPPVQRFERRFLSTNQRITPSITLSPRGNPVTWSGALPDSARRHPSPRSKTVRRTAERCSCGGRTREAPLRREICGIWNSSAEMMVTRKWPAAQVKMVACGRFAQAWAT